MRFELIQFSVCEFRYAESGRMQYSRYSQATAVKRCGFAGTFSILILV